MSAKMIDNEWFYGVRKDFVDLKIKT